MSNRKKKRQIHNTRIRRRSYLFVRATVEIAISNNLKKDSQRIMMVNFWGSPGGVCVNF